MAFTGAAEAGCIGLHFIVPRVDMPAAQVARALLVQVHQDHTVVVEQGSAIAVLADTNVIIAQSSRNATGESAGGDPFGSAAAVGIPAQVGFHIAERDAAAETPAILAR